MTNTLIKIINTLKGDVTLTAIVPATNILTGPVDIVEEQSATLVKPQIVLSLVSEISRSVPRNTRDSIIQLDIWSRNNQMEIETIYERVITLLNYMSADQGSNHIFWQRSSGATDQYETDRRIWHRSCDFIAWQQ